MKKLLITLAVLLTLLAGGTAATVATAGGPPVDEYGCTPSQTYSGPFSAQLGVTGCVGNGTSVTFCHATSSESNPFVTLTTAIAAAVGQAGHFYENGTTQAGHEEDYVGACDVVEPPADTEVAEVAPSMTEGSCDSAGVLTIPEQPEGIVVEVDGPLVGPAETTVTFTAAEGYVLTDGRQSAEYVFVLEGVQDCGTTTEPPVDEPPVDEPPVDTPTPDAPPTVVPSAPAAPGTPTVADTL